MPVYKYRVQDADNKALSGLVEAESEEMAISILQDKGLQIIALSEESVSGGDKKFSFVLDRVKAKDLVGFSRQFSVLISANVAVVQALKLLVEQTENLKLKMVVSEIADDIDEGSRLSDALKKHPKIFSDFYVHVIKSGETSGKLDEVLNYLADELEKDFDMMSKIKGAMIYPAFVFFGMIGIGIVMMIFVVPKLTDVITQAGGELPFATKLLIWTSGFLMNYWYIVIIIVFGALYGIKMLWNVPATKQLLDIVMLRVPIFGKLFQRIYLVRFTRSLQTLLIGGVNLSKGLEICSQVVGNSVYKNLISETKKNIEDGNSIAAIFMTSPVIPSMVSQMMVIGEKTGKLDLILERITDFYSREISNIVANLMTLMEPIIMVVMGVGVGFMVAAIIMPMYQMASAM